MPRLLAQAAGLKYDEEPGVRDRPLPPYYWAAFVLSGDWAAERQRNAASASRCVGRRGIARRPVILVRSESTDAFV